MAEFTTLIFDLDGTLTDPALGVVRCMNYALTKFDYSPLPDAEITQHIGPPLEQTFELLSGSSNESHITELAAAYRERYGELGYKENTVYPGIINMLESLKDQSIRLAVCTSKLEINANRVLEQFQLLDYFEFVNGAVAPGPKGKQLAELLQQNLIDRSAIMIGDRHVDLRAARENKLASAAVLWGYGSEEELQAESPAFIFRSPEDLAVGLS